MQNVAMSSKRAPGDAQPRAGLSYVRNSLPELVDPNIGVYVRRRPPVASWRQRTSEANLRRVRQARSFVLNDRGLKQLSNSKNHFELSRTKRPLFFGQSVSDRHRTNPWPGLPLIREHPALQTNAKRPEQFRGPSRLELARKPADSVQ